VQAGFFVAIGRQAGKGLAWSVRSCGDAVVKKDHAWRRH